MSERHKWSDLRAKLPSERRVEAEAHTQRMLAEIDAIAEIKRRPYHWELVPEEGGTWFARIVEFPGCMTSGAASAGEAVAMLDDAMSGWLQVMLEDGDAIPNPSPSNVT